MCGEHLDDKLVSKVGCPYSPEKTPGRERPLPNSDVEADVALGRCAPSGPRSLTPVVVQTRIGHGEHWKDGWFCRMTCLTAPTQMKRRQVLEVSDAIVPDSSQEARSMFAPLGAVNARAATEDSSAAMAEFSCSAACHF